MSIGDYFGKLQLRWDELATYDSILSCVCGLCICDLDKKFQQKEDNGRLHDFLCGIYVERFGALRCSLLSQDPPPTLDHAYHAMLQEEQLRSHRHKAAMAMATQSPSRGLSRSDTRSKCNISCTFCHHSGHDISSCFSKHGFSKWWGDRPRGSGREGGLKPAGNQLPAGTSQAGQRRETALAAYAPAQGGGTGGSATSVVYQGGATSFTDSDWFTLKHVLGNSGSGSEDRLTGIEPKSFKESMKFPEWREAMKKEIQALEDNGTLSMVELPKGKKALSSQWVYKSLGVQHTTAMEVFCDNESAIYLA
ncbi:hypothetical protein LIER_17963 [Lithospermum erythrorhizon]|uniref:Uncharacterized protein n=1 Tax=Lithospermum erythrorhizon TaxID=34254 RepID=A0AAV3QCB8_LITER